MSTVSPQGPAGLKPSHEQLPAQLAQAHRVVCSRGVAQPGSALQWGCRGREFESRRPDQSDTSNRPSLPGDHSLVRRLVRGLALGLAALALAACGGSDPRLAFDRGQYDRALVLSRAAAEKGDFEAMNLLGIQYYLGAGPTRDFSQAQQWFERAAWGGSAQAQLNLGMLYLRGLGVTRDLERAYAWMERARLGGNPRAQHYLAIIALQITPNQIMFARGMLADEEKGRGRAPGEAQ